jgi:glycerol kinase
MELIKDSKDSEHEAKKVSDTAGVYVVPAFVGLGTPYWDDDARGAVFGLTRGANWHHFVRAALFSIAYQSKDVIEAMKKDGDLELKSLKVDGGASANKLLMQFQSDILQCEVHIPACVETTALGAGYFAGLGVGFWKNKDEIQQCHNVDKVFTPTMSKEEVDKLYKGWLEAVKATRVYKPGI